MKTKVQILKRIKSIPGDFNLLEELSSSPISKVFLCTFNNIHSVIRIDLLPASKLAIDRRNEINLLETLIPLDLSPKILYFDEQAGLMIWKYISGKEPIFDLVGKNKCSLNELGRSLNLIHSSLIPQNSKNIFTNSLNLYKNLLNDTPDQYYFNKAIDLYHELIDDGVSHVFSHNDLHKSNLIWCKKFYFLDWEYSSLNHPYFDIASLIRSFKLNEKQANDLYLGYISNNNILDLSNIEKWINFIEYLENVWKISLKRIQANQYINLL